MASSTSPTKSQHPSNGEYHLVLRVAVGSSNPSKIRAVKQALERAMMMATPTSTSIVMLINKDDRHANGHGDTVDKDPDSSPVTLPSIDIQGFSVESGVASQPFGDTETLLGARNRAKAARLAYKQQEGRFPHLAVGLEGGLEWIGGDDSDHANNHPISLNKSSEQSGVRGGPPAHKSLHCMAWMAVYGRRTGAVVDLFAGSETKTYNGDKRPIFGVSKTATFAMPAAISKLVVENGMELAEADDLVFNRVKSKHGSGTVGILTRGLIDRSAYYEHALLLALIPWLNPDRYPSDMAL